ncbi:TPA: hypothetical protein DF272_03570 [Candidatus Falkowbacteria bacterium]|nr:hypothetical protein [Candidatus Falkowbacteria bacterium]
MKSYFKQSIKWIGGLSVISIFFLLPRLPIIAQTVDDLDSQIKSTQEKIQELEKQQAIYKKNIQQKQEEAVSLQNQIDVLTNKIAQTKLEIETTEQEVKKNELEIRQTELQILTHENEIDKKKGELGETLKHLHYQNDTGALEIFVLNNSLSDFFIHLENTKILSNNLQKSLDSIKRLKGELETQKSDMDKKHTQLTDLKQELKIQQAEFAGEVNYKDDLLFDTKESEQKFYDLFWQAKQEQEAANNEIYNLEKLKREQIDAATDTEQPALTDSTLIWPVTKNTVTAYFHDKSYPFRHIFEHPAIDIRAAQSTPIRASADGYVLKARDAGMGYSYIALIHANGLSTVYGHVSALYVSVDEYVSKGEVIGLSGGAPGTPGAGNLTTGPHLHFEVRLNGIPVDPLLYLP